MSDDEMMAMLASAALFFFYGIMKFVRALQMRRLSTLPAQWPWVALAWVAAEVMLWFVLTHYASYDVQNAPVYLGFYMIFGSAWLAVSLHAMQALDWHYAEDVLERRNPAAALAQCGAILGIMLSFAGANIGDGPSWGVVLFCAILSTGSLMLVWLIVSSLTGWSAHISVERHPGSGLVAAAYFVAGGLIAGRAVAGDWISADATLADFFRDITPLPLLGVMAALFQKWMLPAKEERLYPMTTALAAAFLFLGYAVFVTWLQGPAA